MKQLAHFDIACAAHGTPDARCANCRMVQQFGREADEIRDRRAGLLQRIKIALREKMIVISDFR